METMDVSYTQGNKPEFMSDLRGKVQEFFEQQQASEQGNLNLLLQTVFMLALYIIPYLLMMFGVVESLSIAFICWVLMGFGMAGIGMVTMHDANHQAFSPNYKTNYWLSKSLYLLGGFPPNWRHQHNTMHHGYPNVEGMDEDIAPVGILRLSPHKPLKKIHRFQHIYAWFLYGLMTFSWVFMKDYKQLTGYRKRKIVLSNNKSYAYLFTDLIVTKLVYYFALIVLPILVLPFAWYWTILFFLVMHFIAGLILGVIFQTAHVVDTSIYPLPDKNGLMQNSWAEHQLLTTSDFAPKNKILSWLIGGLNYQVEHHLFPNISHVHYPKIAGIVRDTAKNHGLPYHIQKGFFNGIAAHARMLKRLGRGIV